MRDALNATGRPILFSACEWAVDFPATWMGSVANSWRCARPHRDQPSQHSLPVVESSDSELRFGLDSCRNTSVGRRMLSVALRITIHKSARSLLIDLVCNNNAGRLMTSRTHGSASSRTSTGPTSTPNSRGPAGLTTWIFWRWGTRGTLGTRGIPVRQHGLLLS